MMIINDEISNYETVFIHDNVRAYCTFGLRPSRTDTQQQRDEHRCYLKPIQYTAHYTNFRYGV